MHQSQLRLCKVSLLLLHTENGKLVTSCLKKFETPVYLHTSASHCSNDIVLDRWYNVSAT